MSAVTPTIRPSSLDPRIAARLKRWKRPKPRYTRGVLAKYAATVASASLGAVTDGDLPR